MRELVQLCSIQFRSKNQIDSKLWHCPQHSAIPLLTMIQDISAMLQSLCRLIAGALPRINAESSDCHVAITNTHVTMAAVLQPPCIAFGTDRAAS